MRPSTKRLWGALLLIATLFFGCYPKFGAIEQDGSPTFAVILEAAHAGSLPGTLALATFSSPDTCLDVSESVQLVAVWETAKGEFRFVQSDISCDQITLATQAEVESFLDLQRHNSLPPDKPLASGPRENGHYFSTGRAKVWVGTVNESVIVTLGTYGNREGLEEHTHYSISDGREARRVEIENLLVRKVVLEALAGW